MSKAYAKMRAEEKKKSSSASSQKKDKFQQAYEQGTEIYNQNRQNTIQEVRRLQQSLDATSGIAGKTASTARTYLDNLVAYRARLASLGMYGYDVARQYSALGGTAQMAQQIRGMSQAQYLQDVRFPQKYAGQGIGNINLAIQRLSNGNAQQKAEAKWLKQHRLDFVDTSQLQRAQKTNASAIERMTADRNQYHGAARSNWYDKNREQYDAVKAASGQLNRAIYERTYGDLLEKMPTALKNDLINVAGKAQAWEGETTEENRKNAQGYVQVRNDLKKAGYTDDQIAGLMDYARRQYNATATAADIQKWADRIDGGFWNGAGASAASVPMNLAGGVAGYLDMAGQRLLGIKDPLTGTRKPIDYNSGANRFSNVSSGIRAAVGEHLNGFQNFLYQTGMSMGDFGLAALTGQAEILLAGSAAQQATQEAHLRGASDDQALFVGLLSGAAEAAFEHLSIENLRGIKNAVNKGMLGGKFLARAVGLQSLTEGSEEGLTTIANLISDAILMGDESQVNQQIRENILNGMSEKDATVSAWTEQAKGLLMDIAGGMLSGALIGGAQTGISAAQFGAVNRSVRNAMESAQKADADLKAVRKVAQEQYGVQAKAVESVFEAGTADAETFQRQFQTAYDLGKSGAAMETAMNTTATADLNELQRENAWLIGRDAGIREGTIKEEANENGKTVRVRGSSERDAGASALGSVQQVESGTGSYQEGRSLGIGEGAAYSAAQTLRYSSEVKSARELGIENGAVIQNLRTVDETSYTPEMKEYADEQAEKGHRVVYLSGMIHAQDAPGGMVTRSRGMVNTNGDIFVQVDHQRFTAMQIARHEDAHTRIQRGEIDLQRAKDAVRQSLGEEEYKRAVYDYTSAYAGIDMTDDEAFEEIVCDAEGGMNIFEGTALKKEYDRNARIAEAARKAVRENAGEQKAAGTRAPPEEKTKFSMEAPVEETRDLIAVHNLTYDNLRRAAKLGGIPMPSIAIVKGENGFNQYGPMSFVFYKDTIDPKKNRKNRIYGADAWTPTAANARVEYPIDIDKSIKFERKISDLAEKVAGGIFSKTSVIRQRGVDEDTTMTAAELAERLSEDSSVRAAYLADKGENVEKITKKIEDFGDRGIGFVKKTIDAFGEDAIKNLSESLYAGERLTDAQEDMLRELFRKDWIEKLPVRIKDRRGMDFVEAKAKEHANNLHLAKMEDWVHEAAVYLEGGGIREEVDKIATDDAIKQKAPQKDVIAWLLPQIEEFYGEPGIYNGSDPYTRSGNRKTFKQLHWDYTLDNIVKAMVKTAPQRGAGLWGATPTGLQSVAAPEYRSIAEVKADSGRLARLSEEEYNSRLQEVESEISYAIEAFLKDNPAYGGADRFGAVDSAGSALIQIASKLPKSAADVKRFAAAGGDDVTGNTAQKIYDVIQLAANLPTDYFEAKPQRSIGFEEIAQAIIPANAPADIKNILNDLGVPVSEYEYNNDEDRTEKLNAVENVKFSRELDDEYLQAAQSGDVETAQRMVDEAAKKAGYKKEVYHGTNVEFTEFKEFGGNEPGYHVGNRSAAEDRVRYELNKRVMRLYAKLGKTIQMTDVFGLWHGVYDYVLFSNGNESDMVDRGLFFSKKANKTFKKNDGVFIENEAFKKMQSAVNAAVNGGYKWSLIKEAVEAQRNYLLSLGIDSVEYKNVYEGVGSKSYMLLHANQVKSADPITYDDDGNIIPLSERFNPEQTDIRFSREDNLSELRQENRELKRETDALTKAVQKWKRETKRTERYSVREEDVRRSAKDLIKTLNSTADAAEITADMKALAEYIMNGENGEAASWLTVREMADRIADKVVGAEQVNIRGDVFNEYQRLTEILKGKTLHIDPEAVPDLQGYENLLEFNRANMGTMRLSAKEMKPGDKSVQDAYYEMIEAMPGWFPEDASTDAEMVANMLEVLDGLRPVYGMSDETSYHYDEAVTWAANDIIDRVLDENIRQMPKTFADRAQEKYDKERARLYQRIREVREQGNERVERTKREYAARSKAATDRMRQRQEKQIADLKAKQKVKEQNARERRDTTATWHKIQRLGASFRQMVEHPAQAATKHAPRELAKALQGVADVFYTENRRRSNQTVNAAIQNLAVQFDALKDTEQGIYYDPMLAELNRAAEKALLNVPANEMTPEQIDAVYRLLRAHMKNITSANKFVTGKWAKTIWETGRDWAREVDGASPIMKGWTGDFLNWQLRPDSFFKRISGFAKDSVGERVQKMFSDGTEKMLRIQQDAYYTFREFTESKQFDRLSKRGKGDLVDVGLKDADGKPVLLTRDMMLAVYMNLRNEQNLQAATYGGIEVPSFGEYYTGRTNTSYRHRTTTMNVGGETLELQNERRDLEHSLRSGELSEEAAEEARTRLQEIEDEIRQRADEITGQMLKVRSNIESELTDYEKRFADAAAEWMRKSADYLNAETMAMYGIEKAQVPNYWPLHRDLSFVNTDMRTIADEINLENVGFLKERVQSSAPIMLAGFTFELENHTRRVSEYCGFAAVQRDFNKLYNTKLTREGSSLERKIRDKFGDEQRKMGASGQQYIDAYIASVSGADKADATVFSLIRRNLPRATLTLNLRVAVSQLASMPTAAAEIGWGSAAKGLPRGLKTAFSRKAKAELARKNPWFWQRYRGEGGMREFADMREERNWLDRTWNKFAGMPVVRNLVNWCQDFDVFATASMWAMSEEWVKSNTDYKPGTEEFDRAVGEKYADVIRRTQPNYTVTERSGLLRDKREGYKLLTMYKTQSNQNLNVLYDANATLIKYKKDLKAGRNGVTKEDVKAAQRQFARAYTAVILGGSVSFAILRAGANAILHAMNSYRDDDDEVTLESTLNGILSETASAMAGMFAFGSAVYDAVHALVSGEKYYGLNESAIEALSNLAEQSMTIAQKAIDRDKDVEQKDVEKLVKNACNILGLPWNNARTIVEGVVNHVKDAQNGEFLSFEAGVNRTAAQEANRIIDGYLVGAGDRVKRAWNELLELKGDEEKAQSAMRSAVQDAYVAGDLTDKQAADLLKRYGGVKEKDAAAKVLEYQCERDTGVKYSKLKEAYLDGELTESAAKKALAKYGGKDSEAAEKTVTGWAAEKDTGFALGELKEAYLDGDISRERAIQARVKYGGVEPEKAEEDALKWDVQKEFGVEYGVQNVQEAVAAGELSETDARAIWMEYGGKSEEDADELIAAANFKAAHSDVDLDDVTASRIQIYEQYAPEGTDAAEFMSYAAQIRKDQNAGKYPGIPDGKGGKKPYSVMDDVAGWINSLPISDGEKTALLLTYTNGKTTSLSRYNWS